MSGVAVATTSAIAADAAAEIAREGGNAVDCAVAAALLTMNTEPGVCALAGSAFVTVQSPGDEAVTIDGNVCVPGIGMDSIDPTVGFETVHMEYGGGVETIVGPASVAVPGSLAALDRAVSRYGRVEWKKIVAPTVRAARDGFPLSAACHHYLQYSGEPVFSRAKDSRTALYDGDQLRDAASAIKVPHLADTLDAIALEGSDLLYRGELGAQIVKFLQARGGRLTREDLEQFDPVERPSLITQVSDWTIASNPPPAVGGAVLSALITAFHDAGFNDRDVKAMRHLVDVQLAVLGFRTSILDLSDDIRRDIDQLLELANASNLAGMRQSSSTVHTSAVDADGLACAITASSGYGSGEMPDGTGLWLNNCLGELELNQRGLEAGPPGARLPSNMAPTVARCGDRVLAVGSPGADRITTALMQFLVNVIDVGMSLEEAIDYPRIHVDTRGEKPVVAAEPGLPLDDCRESVRQFPDKGMYFGGVGAAQFSVADGFEVAADPRREGGTLITEN